jgi:RNA-directed DNA polymerase
MNWDDAGTYCSSLTLGGFPGWRLPTLAEMRSEEYLYPVTETDKDGFDQTVDYLGFKGNVQATQATRIWTSSVAGVMENGLVGSVEEGTPQGGPLSPLLSNLVLDELDRELERRNHCFVRYADDCNIYVRSQRAGERVKQSITGFITRRLKLKVNEEKSAVARPVERKFLGFSFTANGRKRRIAPKAILRFKRKARELTSRTRGISLEQMTKELAIYLRGWKGYFGFCQTPSVLERLDQWLRRRMRTVIWKQWKRGTVRYRKLCARGIKRDLAAHAAGNPRGPWRVANSPAMNTAYPPTYFDSIGLPRLLTVT